MQTGMQVRPPKQVWLGRPVEKRFEVVTLTGDAAAERLAEEPVSAEALAGAPAAPAKKRRFRGGGGAPDIPGVYGPRVYKPQVDKPGLNIGPGGINFRAPHLRGPSMSGPQIKGMNLDMAGLKGKMGGAGGGAPAPTGTLLPSQGVFRQKPWLPWWLVPVGIALIALAILLYMLLPKNVVVPDLVGSKSAFEAQKQLTDAHLRLAGMQQKVDPAAPAGSILEQTPAAGAHSEKASAVTVLVAVGDGKVTVPGITGKKLADAEKALRDEKLSLGTASPQPPDPGARIATQIPAESEIADEGTPVDIFFADDEARGQDKTPPGSTAAGKQDGDRVVPALQGQDARAYGPLLGDAGLLPVVRREFSELPKGRVIRTEPGAGMSLRSGATVTMYVSAGSPEVVFDDGDDVRQLDGGKGEGLEAVAAGRRTERDPEWSYDGTRVVYSADGALLMAEPTRRDAPPLPLLGAQDGPLEDPAWAATTEANILAMLRRPGDPSASALCFSRLTTAGASAPACLARPPGVVLDSRIRWAPDGMSVVVLGARLAEKRLGLIRYRTRRAFSPDLADWEPGRFVTSTRASVGSTIDAAVSPDGRRLAVVSGLKSPAFQLYLTTPDNLDLRGVEPLPVRACEVEWRSDSQALFVAQSDARCSEPIGSISRISIEEPRHATVLTVYGDNPSARPVRVP